jgi:hypothetical protein
MKERKVATKRKKKGSEMEGCDFVYEMKGLPIRSSVYVIPNV